ncbi:glycosyltransferase family 1 protein [Paenirhodobacter populi]|uniref:glycosyltransferase family 1 protein n=1 Tax=Paenirhodobacter populi TaxID=2306993 RepID=UPI000FE3085A|nr:glycosyltransferase family 1 protein [Sinirhodobacter populi]RWR04650.1 glycosyltransferase family 1 protein [Sinirhodobacter populi]
MEGVDPVNGDRHPPGIVSALMRIQMPRRYLFLCPDRRTASGGIAVIYDTVVTLRRLGYDAAVVHNSANAGYPDYADAPQLFYTLEWRKVWASGIGVRAGLRERCRLLIERFRGGHLSRLDLRPSDVIVTPEYMLAETMGAFPEQEIGVFVQNPFSFQKAHAHALSQGNDIRKRAKWFIGVSGVCHDQFDLLGIREAHHLPVSMKPEEFPFGAEKDDLITYMPRKRPVEAKLIVEALSGRGHIGGYRIEPLENLPRAEIAARLRRSRFFISLQKAESIGFPAAEAMAAGCIVVGYTGLGGREYFTDELGIPVTEDDTAGLVRALEMAVAEYATDPTRLDDMRTRASAEINRRFSRVAFDEALRAVWK